MRNNFLVVLPLSILLSAWSGFGQSAHSKGDGNSQAVFEVATIKPSLPGAQERWNQSASHYVAMGQTLTDEIEFAYDVRGYQVPSRPSWADSQRYDFAAKASDSTIEIWEKLPPDQQMQEVRAMVRALLADRCGLQVRWETQQQRVFALVVDKGGAKLKSVAAADPSSLVVNYGFLRSHGISMAGFANLLETQDEIGDRKVLDETGLNGFFDVSLGWKSVRSTSDSIGSSVFTALSEELGLKLVSRKAPVQVLVIEKLERPSAN